MKPIDKPYHESQIMKKAQKMLEELLNSKTPDPQKMNLVKLALSYELTRKKLTTSGFGDFFNEEDEFSNLIDKDDFGKPEEAEKPPTVRRLPKRTKKKVDNDE